MASQLAPGSKGAADARLERDAVAFATEFARLGYSPRQLMELFADPFYGPAFMALRRLGEPAVRAIVAEAVRARRARPRVLA